MDTTLAQRIGVQQFTNDEAALPMQRLEMLGRLIECGGHEMGGREDSAILGLWIHSLAQEALEALKAPSR